MSRFEGWQFTSWASLGRETTARLFGPLFGWFMRGPRAIGREHLAEVEWPAIVCPTHASHLDVSALRLALGPHRQLPRPAVVHR